MKLYAKVILIMFSTVVVIAAAILSSADPNRFKEEYPIEIENISNSPQNLFTSFRLTNSGTVTVALDKYCTIYWTNAAGYATDMFFAHNLGFARLVPGQAQELNVRAPADSKIWNISIGYTIMPGSLKRITEEIKGRLTGYEVPDDNFTCLISPDLTNETNEGRKR
jgi:hypothetical protein